MNNFNTKILFKKFFMLAVCMAIMLAINIPKVGADIIQVPQTPGTESSWYGVFETYWYGNDVEHLLTADELASCEMSSGLISAIQVNYGTTAYPNVGGISSGSFNIWMANAPATQTTLTDRSTLSSMENVLNISSGISGLDYFGGVSGVDQWVTIPLDEPFMYTGGALLIRFCNSTTTYGNYIQYRGRALSSRSVGVYSTGSNPSCPSTGTSQATPYLIPNFRFDIEMEDASVLENYYRKGVVSHNGTSTRAISGMANVSVLNFRITTGGDLSPYQQLDNITFSGKESIDKISKAYLYYTANKSIFHLDSSYTELLAEIDFSQVENIDTFSFDFPVMSLAPHGQFNFWLVYDVSRGCPTGEDLLDAEYVDMHLYTTNGETIIDPAVETPDPEGAIDVIAGGYVYAGPGGANPTNTNSFSTGWPGYNYYNVARQLFTYNKEELGDLSGTINNIAFNVYTYSYSGNPRRDSNFILMRNSPDKSNSWWPLASIPSTYNGTLTALGVPDWLNVFLQSGWVIVKGPFTWDNVGSSNYWLDVELDVPFEYTGGDLDVIACRFNLDSTHYYYHSGTTYPNYWYPRTYSNGYYSYSYEGSNPTNVSGSFYSYPYTANGVNSYSGTVKPNARFNFDYAPGQKFKDGLAFHTDKIYAGCGAENVEILGTSINIMGKNEDPYMHLKRMRFDGKQSYDNQQITHARLYYSGIDSAFSTAVQVGESIVVSADNIHNLEFEVPGDGLRLTKGKNYFWLSYQIEGDESKSNYQLIDAKLVECLLNKVDNYFGEVYPMDVTEVLSDLDPTGSKTIRAPLRAGVYYVGVPFENPDNVSYATLSACAREFSEIGVTVNTEIRIISSIEDTATAIFGAAPFGDNIEVVLRPADGKTGLVLTNPKNDSNSAVIRLAGAKNFHIYGSNLGVDGSSYDLSLVKSGAGKVIDILSGSNEMMHNLVLVGAGSAINISNTNGFSILNNRISKSSGNIINVYNGSSNGLIDNNIIGYNLSESAIGNGLSFLGGSHHMVISNNIVRNIQGNADLVSAINIKGNVSLEDLSFKIYNNNFSNVSNSKDADLSVFSLENASNIMLYHNTTLQNNKGGAKYASTIYVPTNTVSLHLRNNLFNNLIVNNSTTYSQMLRSNNSSLFSSSDYNLYNGNNTFYLGLSSNNGSTFEDWRLVSGVDANSNRTSNEANYIGDLDFHIDGSVVGSLETLVPVLDVSTYPGVEKDMDGVLRGLDANYIGMTTVGADEAMLNIRIVDTAADLPLQIIHCEDSGEDIMIPIMKLFDGWTDGVARSYVPVSTNIWVNTENGDILSTENGGYKTDYYPYIYIDNPVYPQSIKFKCLSNVGYFVSETGICDLKIIKEPEFVVQPEDVVSCINTGVVEVSSDIYGSYESLQWEKEVNGSWVSVSEQVTKNMSLTFPLTQAGVNSVEGKYRLRINTLVGYCDLLSNYYSDTIDVSVGYPLTDYVFSSSHTLEQYESGICRGEEIWLAAGIPVGDTGTVTGYMWEKFDVNIGEWLPISQEVNPTAGKDTFRIHSARIDEDAGIYRCVILGISVCTEGSSLTLPAVVINITETAEIVSQPLTVFACLSSDLLTELSTKITEPEDVLYNNEYAWYKDGELFIRYNNVGEVISISDDTDSLTTTIGLQSLYSIRRTDTTYLPFHNLTFDDEGLYKLRLIYTNCVGEIDTVFTEEVALYIYGKTEIIEQTTSTYAIRGGFVDMEVNVVTPGATQAAPVTYSWHRMTPSGDILLADDGHFYGTKSPRLTILNISDVDLTNLNTTEDYYYCIVTGLCNGIGDTSLPAILKVAPEINITTQPKNTVACLGTNAILSVVALQSDITEPIGYTWYKDGIALTDNANISGSNTADLTISNTTFADAGSYDVVIYYVNLDGAMIRTNKATLTIEIAPQITSIINGANNTEIIDTLKLEIGDDLMLQVNVASQGTALYTYQWYYNDEELTGETNELYYFENVAVENSGWYKIKVTSNNGCGETYDSVFVLVNDVGIFEKENANFQIINVLPNPVTGSESIIKYILPAAQQVNFSLIDETGRTVCELYNGMGIEGPNSLEINDKLNHLSSGTYFVILTSNNKKAAYKINISK